MKIGRVHYTQEHACAQLFLPGGTTIIGARIDERTGALVLLVTHEDLEDLPEAYEAPFVAFELVKNGTAMEWVKR